MKFDILTIFPDIIYHYCNDSILHLAQKKELVQIQARDFRNDSTDKFHRVDDKPYGGGAGMILQAEPIYNCLEKMGLAKDGKKVKKTRTLVIIMDPAGKKFNQKMAQKFAKLDQLVIISGRYEGFDARIYNWVDEKVSVGQYVLAGGELPALIITEAVSRLIPGVLGNEKSLDEETFTIDGKEYPQYTRPEDFIGEKVPEILLCGDHKKIKEWREKKTK